MSTFEDMNMSPEDEEEFNNVTEYFRYLDALRDSGITNMFGAAPYLAKEFDLDKPSARYYTTGWMKYFTEGHPADRAKMFMEKTEIE